MTRTLNKLDLEFALGLGTWILEFDLGLGTWILATSFTINFVGQSRLLYTYTL